MGKIIINGIDYSGGGGGGGGASSEAIAPIEETSTATQSHPAGSLLFLDNILYKAKTALAIGDTIITEGANANVEATDIDTQLKNKINLSSTVGLVKNDGTIDTSNYATESYVDNAIPSVDTELSSTSENTVQNKVIYTALQDKASITAVNNAKTYKLTLTNVSALPQSWSVWGDYLDLQVEDFELTNYNAQLNDWQCSITEDEIAGSTATVFTITGNISGSTDITIYLGKPETLTIFDDNFGENPEIEP